jgi:hypothetical protein
MQKAPPSRPVPRPPLRSTMVAEGLRPGRRELAAGGRDSGLVQPGGLLHRVTSQSRNVVTLYCARYPHAHFVLGVHWRLEEKSKRSLAKTQGSQN